MTAGLAQDLARALDPVALAKQALGWDCDDWQGQALRSNADRILLNCSRQAGKSTVGSVAAVHTALYEPGSLTLLLSPTERQSKELFGPVMTCYRALGRPVPPQAENQLSLELETGSRIVSLPGQEWSVRGFSSVRRLIIDEAARVPDDLYRTVRPMLAVSGGQILAMSTPFGRRGWFFREWQSDGPQDRWERYEIPATLCPRIQASFLEEERRAQGQWWFDQEYMCKFLDAQTSAFRQEDIDAAIDAEVEPWNLLSGWV